MIPRSHPFARNANKWGTRWHDRYVRTGRMRHHEECDWGKAAPVAAKTFLTKPEILIPNPDPCKLG